MTIALKNFPYGSSIGRYFLVDVLAFYHPLLKKGGFLGKNTLPCLFHLQKRFHFSELSMVHGSFVRIIRSSNFGLNLTPFPLLGNILSNSGKVTKPTYVKRTMSNILFKQVQRNLLFTILQVSQKDLNYRQQNSRLLLLQPLSKPQRKDWADEVEEEERLMKIFDKDLEFAK